MSGFQTEDFQRLLPEWAAQAAVMLTWPHRHSDWAAILDQVEPVYVAIAQQVCRHEALLVACYDPEHREHVRGLLQTAGVDLSRVHCHLAPSNDTWARDHGPITVERAGHPVLLDFRFNGWGGKYPHDLDDGITARLHTCGAFGATSREPVALVLEGGSIETDGVGTLLTTRECQLAPTRNPGMDKPRWERDAARLFGTPRVLWLDHGALAGDDTDGHIDTLARFCDEQTIAYVSCEDPDDEHFDGLAAMHGQLQGFRDRHGEPYRLIPLPLPAAQYGSDGQRLPATYANFLIINGAVLVPIYGDALDALALERLAEAFPRHQVVGIDCRALIRQYGSLHCVTMQIPQAVEIA